MDYGFFVNINSQDLFFFKFKVPYNQSSNRNIQDVVGEVALLDSTLNVSKIIFLNNNRFVGLYKGGEALVIYGDEDCEEEIPLFSETNTDFLQKYFDDLICYQGVNFKIIIDKEHYFESLTAK